MRVEQSPSGQPPETPEEQSKGIFDSDSDVSRVDLRTQKKRRRLRQQLATIETGAAQRSQRNLSPPPKDESQEDSDSLQHHTGLTSNSEVEEIPPPAPRASQEERKKRHERRVRKAFPSLSPPDPKSPKARRSSSPKGGRSSKQHGSASDQEEEDVHARWDIEASPPSSGGFRERWNQRLELRNRLRRLSTRVVEAAERYRLRRIAFLREREAFIEVYEATRFVAVETFAKVDSLGRGALDVTNKELAVPEDHFTQFRRAVEEDALPYSGIPAWDFEDEEANAREAAYHRGEIPSLQG